MTADPSSFQRGARLSTLPAQQDTGPATRGEADRLPLTDRYIGSVPSEAEKLPTGLKSELQRLPP